MIAIDVSYYVNRIAESYDVNRTAENRDDVSRIAGNRDDVNRDDASHRYYSNDVRSRTNGLEIVIGHWTYHGNPRSRFGRVTFGAKAN